MTIIIHPSLLLPKTNDLDHSCITKNCSYEHSLCHPFTNPVIPAPHPSGKPSTTAGTNSSPTTKARSKRHHTTKRNFEIFKAPDFIAAALLHLPPKGQQTVRYYGIYSNKTRGRATLNSRSAPLVPSPKPDPPSEKPPPAEILLIPPPPKQSARDMRPLWRDLILQVWGGDPLQCPCCKGTMKPVLQVIRREEIQFFLRLHGLWEGIIQLPRPPPPPFDIETMKPIEPPWQAIKEWIADDEPDLDWFNRPRNPSNPDPEGIDQSPTWQPEEIQLDDERILVLEST